MNNCLSIITDTVDKVHFYIIDNAPNDLMIQDVLDIRWQIISELHH